MSDNSRQPPRFIKFGEDYTQVMAAYNAFGSAAHEAGPLDVKSRALVKLGIAAGSRLEGAVHSHARRALREGCTPEKIRHAILLTATTIGFPAMLAALSCVDEEM